MEYKEFENLILIGVRERVGTSYTVKAHEVLKNNGVVMNGLVIVDSDSRVSPIVYLEAYFKDFKDGADIEKIMDDIYDIYLISKESIPDFAIDWGCFETLKDKVVYKLIRRQGNEDLLAEIPFTPYLDLAVVYYILLEADRTGQMTALIHQEHLELWAVDKETIHKMAEENTKRLLPAQIRSSLDVLYNMVVEYTGDEDGAKEICECLEDDEEVPAPPIFVLSNTTGMNGAACILYDGVLEKFSEEQGGDVIILPSSTHEVLLLPYWKDADFDDLQGMVQNVNKTMVDDVDVLSDHVYLYKRNTKAIHAVM